MAGIGFRKEDTFKKCVLCISAPTISFLSTYLTLFPHWLVRSLTILYVIDTILQVCILVQKYPANLAFPHLYLTGIILIMTLESLTDMSPFAAHLKNDVLGNTQVPSYFMKGHRRMSVLHARLRNNCSDLKSDFFQNHLTDSLSFSCGNVNENTIHYFFECENYSNSRLVMFRSIRKFHPLSLITVLFGKSNLSDDDNFLLFQAVQQYIKDTRRFD